MKSTIETINVHLLRIGTGSQLHRTYEIKIYPDMSVNQKIDYVSEQIMALVAEDYPGWTLLSCHNFPIQE